VKLTETNGHVPESAIRGSFRGDFGPREMIVLGKAASPQSKYQIGYGADMTEEYGRSGLRHWGGFVFEEWLTQLQQGRRAAEVYREMSDQDPIIGAILYAIQMLMRRVSWWCEPKESPGAKFFDEVRQDMMFSWEDTISEILSFLPYGYSYHEMVFKVRNGPSNSRTDNSRYDDGLIGLAKIPLRSQDSLWKWVFDDVGDIEGMIQNPPPDYLLRFIPREKALHFRTTIFKDNPEGRSILRNAYRSWWFIKNIQQIEAIGIERDLAGLPVLTPPEGVDIWDGSDPDMANMLSQAKSVVSSIRRDEQEGVILPFGWTLTLQASAGQRQFDTSAVISRYETRMATSVLADLVMMGQDKVGSYALSVTKKDMFAASLGAYLDIISSIFNTQCIPLLWKLNGRKDEMPKLCHGGVETIDLDTLGNFINRVGRAGAPIAWETTLPWMNEQAGIPAAPEGHDYSPRMLTAPTQDGNGNDADPSGSKGEGA
jgi:hypothetical protein